MLLVPAELKKSFVHGTGVFCIERIKAGTEVWRFDLRVDQAYDKESAEKLPEPRRTEILSLTHSYIGMRTGRYIWPGDNARFMNHSDSPNIGTRFDETSDEDIGYALRDIEPGEELTVDYRGFAAEEANGLTFSR